jgi:hypothetical protein
MTDPSTAVRCSGITKVLTVGHLREPGDDIDFAEAARVDDVYLLEGNPISGHDDVYLLEGNPTQSPDK